MQYKKEAVRLRLLEEGKKEFLTFGYRAGNISHIAKNAGVPVGNLYRYYDGKSGLLDAIVLPAYNEIPHILEHLSLATPALSMPELIELITKTLINLYKTYGEALLILADKCEDTHYADFTDKLSSLALDILLKHLFTHNKEGDRDLVKILSKSLVNSFLDVFRLDCSDSEMSDMIKRLLVFNFYKINERI